MRSKRSSRIALPKSPWDNKVVRAFLYVCVAILLVAPVGAQRGGGRGPSRQQLPQKTDPNEADILATFSGKVFTVTKKEVAITLLDGDHELPFRIGGKTDVLDGKAKKKLADLAVGDMVDVEAKRALDGTLDAVHIKLRHD